MQQWDVIVVGGGLAGLTAAIDLSLNGHSVLVFEKHSYPHHKVCGEYVSNEVVPYLNRLGVSLDGAEAVPIDQLTFSTARGRAIEVDLPLGGKGISRFAFDHLLFRRALALGVIFQFQQVESIEYEDAIFEIVTASDETYTSKLVIGAYGKRSHLDKTMKRDFVNKKSYWLAVKAHYSHEDFPERSVALHSFVGGYGGLSKTETGAVNFCYLVTYESFQKQNGIASFNANVVARNPFLGNFLREATPVFDEPLTIAQISFRPKKAVENHMLMCGDTAGLIYPLCGNGMAMAIHSAKIAAELGNRFLNDGSYGRDTLEKDYQRQWNVHFKKRLWAGRRLQSLLLNPWLSSAVISTLVKRPSILKNMIRNTHGKPII